MALPCTRVSPTSASSHLACGYLADQFAPKKTEMGYAERFVSFKQRNTLFIYHFLLEEVHLCDVTVFAHWKFCPFSYPYHALDWNASSRISEKGIYNLTASGRY